MVAEDELSSIRDLTAIGSTLYFVANNGVIGAELWKSNGTALGTVLIKDILPGELGSSPSELTAGLTAAGGTLFFVATRCQRQPQALEEQWHRYKHCADPPTTGVVSPSELTSVNNTLFFAATDGTGRELWKSNGTAAGTVRVKDIYAGVGSSSPAELTSANGTLYFAANDGSGAELWKSDGTAAGTVLVKDILPGLTGSLPQNLAQVRSSKRILFAANEGSTGVEL